jgi:hypothetical protein
MFGWVPSRPSSYWNDIHQGTSAGSDSFVRAPWSCPGVLASRTVRGKLCHRSSKSWWNLMEFYGSSMELWDSRKYWNSMIFYVKRHVYSLEFSWLLKILMNFHEFSGILMNSHDISWILEQYNKKTRLQITAFLNHDSAPGCQARSGDSWLPVVHLNSWYPDGSEWPSKWFNKEK